MAKPFIDEALLAERQIKGWNHNKKKEVMIHGDWAEVGRLAKSKYIYPLTSLNGVYGSFLRSFRGAEVEGHRLARILHEFVR